MVTTPCVETLILKNKKYSGKSDIKELNDFVWHTECYFKTIKLLNEKEK